MERAIEGKPRALALIGVPENQAKQNPVQPAREQQQHAMIEGGLLDNVPLMQQNNIALNPLNIQYQATNKYQITLFVQSCELKVVLVFSPFCVGTVT